MKNTCYGGLYRQQNRIGAGKYGIIYKVTCLKTNIIYIAKHVSLINGQQQISLKELQIIKQLKHPYIVQYIDSFLQENQLIIIMEYCGEKDLSYHIELMKKKKQFFSQNLIVNWLLQLVLAMQFIHSKKILHRDIKPQNIFIDQNMSLKVGDFGISKVLNNTAEQCKTVVGTPYYLAPQICAQDKYTNKADIWSLGCVIYEVCALERPFLVKEGGIFQLFDKIKSAQVKNIPSIYSKDLQAIVKKMITADQKKRPNTIKLLQDPLLVQLMISNTSQVNLKKQYPKSIQKPSMTQSYIDEQTQIVRNNMKKFEEQVKLKMNVLKNKHIEKKDIDKNYKQIKQKMKMIQKAVKVAFQEMRDKCQESSKIVHNSSQKDKMKMDCNISGVSCEQSIYISKNTDNKDQDWQQTVKSIEFSKQIGKLKKSGLISESQLSLIEKKCKLVNNNPIKKNKSNINENNNKNKSNLESNKSSQIKFKNNNQQLIQNTQQNQQNQMQKTINSNYIQTINNKLELLTQTINKNPQTLLNNTFMSETLSLSNTNIKIPFNHQDELNEVQFNLTKKQQKQIQQNDNYDDDFQQYQDDEKLEESIKKKSHDKRKSQLAAIVSFFQQNLQQMQQNTLKSQTAKMRQKYPLDMSQIKQLTNETSSIVSHPSILDE